MSVTTPLCGIVIPTYNGAGLTGACLGALLSNPPARCRWRIVVVDDGSTDRGSEQLRRFEPQVTLLELPVNAGFASACNAGAAAAEDCDYLVFLNNDTIPTSGWLDALVDELEAHEETAAVGAKLLYPHGEVQHAGVVIGQDRWPHHIYAGFPGDHPAVNRAREMTAVTGACLLIRREDFESLDGFDTSFHNGYEDIDLCLRLRERGRRIRYCPSSVVYHLESVTRWPDGSPQGTEVSDREFQRRWRHRLTPDDVAHFIEDGLIQVSYGPHHPLTFRVAPELAVIARDGEDSTGLERILALRSRQVMELIGKQVRSESMRLSTASLPTALAENVAPPQATLICQGREHQLGDGHPERLISVALPVKDGAAHLERLLPALLAQELPARLEIIAIDSGSSDASLEVLERFGATVLRIDAARFNHGATRNLLAEHASGETLVFLSQRSLPAGPGWLAPLVATLETDALVAGVCSRVVPHADADLLTRRDVERDLSASTRRRQIRIEDPAAYAQLTVEERRVFLNFHTVSAALRTETWRQIPFRPVKTLGEDLLWAREVVEAGWTLVHEPASVVHHSHTYSVPELFARNVDDGVANRDIVGRTMDRSAVLPMAEAMMKDDWAYLREIQDLHGQELERWQLEAAVRRLAQAAGQWVGLNYESLPDGAAAAFSSRSRPADPRGS